MNTDNTNEKLNISIVIPTWNRAHLLEALLCSLRDDITRYKYGVVEIIVVDSSDGEQQQSIQRSCATYGADYYENVQSVRKKRNYGVRQAKHPVILFIDSDVVVKKNLINYHAEQYLHPAEGNLGGVLGYTEFVGKMSFWWKILENTSLIDSFSFAKKYPFNSWTIGNNVSFYKQVLLDIGLFEENLPFKLGGDDLDLSYRVTKSGYMIASCPESVTYHSRETWNNWKSVHDRAKRWGIMEAFITQRHPELLKRAILPQLVLSVFILLAMAITALVTYSVVPLLIYLTWMFGVAVTNYFVQTKGKINPFYYFAGQAVMQIYQFYRANGYLKLQKFAWFFYGVCFNHFQIKFGMANEAKRLWVNFLVLWGACLAWILTYQVFMR